MPRYGPSLQEPSTIPDQALRAEPGASVVVVCGRQDILGLVSIISVALFPEPLALELSTCATRGLALIRSRQPQLLVCIEPLVVEGDTLALISQAKRLPTAPKALLICNLPDSQLSREIAEAYCDGILGINSADAGAVVQALRVVLNGGRYRDPALTTGPWPPHGDRGSQQDYKLTAREQQVLQLIVQGHSNREIGESLHLGISTVKTHVGQLLDKLGARDRTQAAVQAIALRLVPWPSASHGVR
ncbi:MAG: response regulator transcription factor [Cyanobacteria bacterium MAG CAR1_bin_15]|nr:response regulator transcription factor [Cyanobacteria bacterium MAG CAR1_bin_15]